MGITAQRGAQRAEPSERALTKGQKQAASLTTADKAAADANQAYMAARGAQPVNGLATTAKANLPGTQQPANPSTQRALDQLQAQQQAASTTKPTRTMTAPAATTAIKRINPSGPVKAPPRAPPGPQDTYMGGKGSPGTSPTPPGKTPVTPVTPKFARKDPRASSIAAGIIPAPKGAPTPKSPTPGGEGTGMVPVFKKPGTTLGGPQVPSPSTPTTRAADFLKAPAPPTTPTTYTAADVTNAQKPPLPTPKPDAPPGLGVANPAMPTNRLPNPQQRQTIPPLPKSGTAPPPTGGIGAPVAPPRV